MNSPLKTIKDYHQQSKHQIHRYARALEYMDWANQPLPYRLYQGAEKIPLALINDETPLPYLALSESINTATPLSLSSVASMLQNSLGLSAWKQYGDSEWALRINPSSGNLHPTECYLLLPDIADQVVRFLHYNPYINSLEKLIELPHNTPQQLASDQGFAIVLTSIAWREAWKYGERAYRYCQHDLGHALATLNIACNLKGWKIQLINEMSPEEAQTLFGFSQLAQLEAEKEWVECVCWISTETIDISAISHALKQLTPLSYTHQANQLSSKHENWLIINNLFNSLHSLPLPNAEKQPPVMVIESNLTCEKSALQIINQRRSAQNFDASNSQIDLAVFLQQLQKTLSTNAIPFNILPYTPQVHLVIFVHNVVGLVAGLYLWCRNENHLSVLQADMSENFSWTQPINKQPLYLLEEGNFKARAKMISCSQDIASDGAYSLGMLAKFEALIVKDPSRYPILFWETGLIGQVLYLQAEAFAMRGTGIGCFFDDEMHKLLGLTDDSWQVLYHFTIGHPIEDTRITTKSAYFHLQA